MLHGRKITTAVFKKNYCEDTTNKQHHLSQNVQKHTKSLCRTNTSFINFFTNSPILYHFDFIENMKNGLEKYTLFDENIF